jgi:hypothetical protein
MTGHPMDNSPHGGMLDYSDYSASEIVSHTPCTYSMYTVKKIPKIFLIFLSISAQRQLGYDD